MELTNLSLGSSACEWKAGSNATCRLLDASPFEVTRDYFPGQSTLLYLASFSRTTIKIPGTNVAIYLGSFSAIIELGVILCVGIAISAGCAYLGYCVNTSMRLTSKAKNALLGSEILMLALMPFAVLTWWGPLASVASNFVMAILSLLGCFRILELALGTGPKGFDSSCSRFVLYVVSPCEVAFDADGYIQSASRGSLRTSLSSTTVHGLLMVLLLSIGGPLDFKPFLSGADPINMAWCGFPTALPAMYLQAALVYVMLAAGFQAFRLVPIVAGIETHSIMRHPLLLSTSVRDFWGRRWNLLVHRIVHRSFFKPLAMDPWNLGPRAGAIAAFMVSALFHEYMWLVTNWHEAQFKVGGPIKFFIAQFVLLTAENFLKRTPVGSHVSSLPAPFLTSLTTLVILPFGPFFLHDLHGLRTDSVMTYPHFQILQ